MFPRPLHRWKSFWLGLLVLLFLVPWAGFLLWRVRQVKRLAGALPVPES